MNDEFLYRQLEKLGEMMGDGLHLEPDGKWIEKEYKKIAKQLGLIPKRKINTEYINLVVENGLKTLKCDCGGTLKQTRKGSFNVKCEYCGHKYKIKRRKIKNMELIMVCGYCCLYYAMYL